MSDSVKKTKLSTESVVDIRIEDIADSVESIAKSLGSVNKYHGNLLRVNKAVVGLQLDIQKKRRRDLNTTVPIPGGN